jgi:hypothetical protein
LVNIVTEVGEDVARVAFECILGQTEHKVLYVVLVTVKVIRLIEDTVNAFGLGGFIRIILQLHFPKEMFFEGAGKLTEANVAHVILKLRPLLDVNGVSAGGAVIVTDNMAGASQPIDGSDIIAERRLVHNGVIDFAFEVS